MTDTTTCPSCNTPMPATAAFCTSCGSKLTSSDVGVTAGEQRVVTAAPADLDEDATRIEGPGLHDQTQVLPGSGPAPVERAAEPPPWSAPTEQQWSATPPAAPGGWQAPAGQQSPPQQAPGWGQPAAPPQPQWAQPQPGPQQWGPPAANAAWTPPPPPAGSAARSGSAIVPAVLAFLGAILLVAGVFSPWLKSKGYFSGISGWDLVTKKDPSGFKRTPDPAILLGIGVASIVVGGLLIAGKLRGIMRLLLAAAGIGAAVILVIDYLGIKDTVDGSARFGKVTYELGFWLCVAAAVILLLAAIMPSRRKA